MFGTPVSVMTGAEKKAWQQIIRLRNTLLHNGPGYLDSVDFGAGRLFVEQPKLSENNGASLARAVWSQGSKLCESRAVLAAATLQGSTPDAIRDELRRRKLRQYDLPAGETISASINAFHNDIESQPEKTM